MTQEKATALFSPQKMSRKFFQIPTIGNDYISFNVDHIVTIAKAEYGGNIRTNITTVDGTLLTCNVSYVELLKVIGHSELYEIDDLFKSLRNTLKLE